MQKRLGFFFTVFIQDLHHIHGPFLNTVQKFGVRSFVTKDFYFKSKNYS